MVDKLNRDIGQGDICWCDLGEPVGAEPGFVRPIVIIQGNPFNRSRIDTVLALPLTSNLKWQKAPGNVLLSKGESGLPKESVALVAQIITVDRAHLSTPIKQLSKRVLHRLFEGIDIVLDR